MKNKKNIIFIIAILILFIGSFALYTFTKYNSNSDKDLKAFNEKLDEYYIKTWDQNKFLSSYSYFVKNDGTEVTLKDIKKSLGYKIPKNFKNVVLHFVKPKTLKPYLKEKISDKDLEILTVYSALPVDGGMYISSKFDEGGILSDSEYKSFVMDNSWLHGEIRTPLKEDEEYKEIIKSIEQKDDLLKDGNVKHIACDDKYAMVVISSKNDPAYIKQYGLEKDDSGKYKVIIEELEKRDSKIFVNYAYTDFNLDLLPLYEIHLYSNISSHQEHIVQKLKQQGSINQNEELTYACGAGNFIYLEFKSKTKILLHSNEQMILDVYEVDNFKTALSQMLKLEKSPPAFILKFE